MKVYISADIEGLWGLVSPKQTGGDGDDYRRARQIMTREINLVSELLFSHGVKEIVVNDAHGSMDNIIIEDLNPDVSLISGYPKDLSMMAGIDDTFDCVMFIGYHPRAGTSAGIFDHTYAGRIVLKLMINGEEVGESGMNAIIAGHFNVPVVLVAGDDKLALNVKEEIGNIETVIVKETITRYCARHVSGNRLKEVYEKAVVKALANVNKYPVKMTEQPLTARLQLAQAVMVDISLSLPGVKRIDARTVEFVTDDAVAFSRLFRSLVSLSASVL